MHKTTDARERMFDIALSAVAALYLVAVVYCYAVEIIRVWRMD